MYVVYIVTGTFMGYATGIAPVFSYDLGSGDTAEIKGLFQKSLVSIGSSAILLTALVMVFARALAAVFVAMYFTVKNQAKYQYW